MSRAGGRNWTLRGGDSYTELGGATQKCEFDEGLYINPGPWRIPYHHNGLLDYCKRLGVQLEPFQQVNHNAFLHSTKAFGGKPQRMRDIKIDFQGHVSELLAKVTQKGKLEDLVAKEDQEMLLEALTLMGRARQGLWLHDRASAAPSFAATRRIRAAGSAPSRCPAAPIGLLGHTEIGPVGQPCQFLALRVPDHHVPAGRRHGPHRRRLCQAGWRLHHATMRRFRRSPRTTRA